MAEKTTANEVLETVKVVSDTAPGGHVVINKSDFDPKVHEVWEDEAPSAPKTSGKAKTADDMTVEELKNALIEQGIDFPAKAKKEELVSLLKGE